MVERPFHHQSHPIRHSAQGQRDRAAGAVEVVGEVAGDGADGQEVFGGVGHEGFGVGAGGEAKKAGFAFGLGFGARFEVVVKGAFGGFVEFLGFQRFVGRYVWGFGGLGVGLIMVQLPGVVRPTPIRFALRKRWQLCVGVQDRSRWPADPKVSDAQPP